MNLAKAQQATMNGIYAAAAWLMLDFGLLIQKHGDQTLSVLTSQPAMAAGAIIVLVCIFGLFRHSRLAATTLFLLFLIPMLLRAIQGALPSSMILFFSLMLLYFFLNAVLGAFSYHQLKSSTQSSGDTD